VSTDQRLAALWSPAFRRYLIGQVPSVTCSWIQVVALATVVVQIDAPALGWVVALQFLPSLVLGPWCGALVDRHDRRRLLMVAEAGLGLVAVAFAVASAVDGLSLGLICALATVWGLFNALDTPARRALIPTLVAPAQAARASSLAATGMLIGMASGSALGAILVAHAGPALAFAVNALSFAADVAILAGIRVAPAPRVPRARGQIRDGLRYVLRTRALRDPLSQLAVVATLGFGVQVSVPVYVRSVLGGGPALIGAALTAVTVGSLTGALAAVVRGAPGPATTSRTTLAMAVALTTTAVAPDRLFAFLGFVGVGLTWSLLLAMVVARLQQADAAMMGRVMSLFATVLIGGMAIGGPIVAVEITYAGPRAPFLIGAGAAALTVGLVLAARPASRPAVVDH
jgi:MFS family permease